MRLAIIASVVFGLAACGGDPSPKEACNDFAVAFCAKIYECYTASELAAAQYPATESACVVQLQTNAGCSAKTDANACDGNEKYHGNYVDSCNDQLGGLECSQVRSSTFDANVAAPACDKVCQP